MKKKLSLLLAAALTAELFVAAVPAGAAPLRPVQLTSDEAPLVTSVQYRRHGRRGGHWRGHNNNAGAIIGGLAAGAIIGGLLAAPRYRSYDSYDGYYERRYYRPRVQYRTRGIDAHQEWCLNRWKSYDVYSDTYQPYNGPRRYCNSPYN